MWRASVRFGYVYGALEWAGGLASQTEALWSAATLNVASAVLSQMCCSSSLCLLVTWILVLRSLPFL